MRLNYNAEVDFYENDHIYLTQTGKQLIGITGMISKMLFPNKYSDIPKHILDNAAKYGTMIHSKCQENDMFDTCDCIETENYVKIKKENGLIPLENEYLVSDNEEIATMIDVVFESSENSVHLADIKTTSVLDVKYLQWQLSVCAYLFELQNLHITVDKLYGIWLRKDEYKLQEVERIPNNIIVDLIDAYLSDSEFENPIKENVPLEIEELIEINSEISVLEERRKQLLADIQPLIEKNKYKDDKITITWVEPSTSVSFDSARFKIENPDIADKYTKETSKSGFLKITYKAK